eukprot:4925614-Pyramimonas_sp.AAC.1
MSCSSPPTRHSAYGRSPSPEPRSALQASLRIRGDIDRMLDLLQLVGADLDVSGPLHLLVHALAAGALPSSETGGEPLLVALERDDSHLDGLVALLEDHAGRLHAGVR